MAAHTAHTFLMRTLANIPTFSNKRNCFAHLKTLSGRLNSQDVTHSYTLSRAQIRYQLVETVHGSLNSSCLPATTRHQQVSSFHTSIGARGLEEFFDDPKNWGQPVIKSGRAWSQDELRLKDFVTLHKLWYILLKERNMLLSMQAEADRQDKFLPSPERINKVEVSMANLQAVLKERQEALTELKTGHTEEHPGEWQYTPFGYKRYIKPREYHIPKYMNKLWATKRKWYDPFFGRYLSRWYEQGMRRGARQKRRKRSQLLKLKKRFPDSDVWQNK